MEKRLDTYKTSSSRKRGSSKNNQVISVLDSRLRGNDSWFLFLSVDRERTLFLAAVDSQGNFVKTKIIKHGGNTEKLLPQIIKFINQVWGNGLPTGLIVSLPKDLSFTQARLICAVGNVLSYGWQIKVCRLSIFDWGVKTISLKRLKWQSMIKVEYYGPGVGG